MKIVIVLMLVAVLGVLAGAGLFMLRKRNDDSGQDRRMARALAVRVALSVALFLLVLLGWSMGWVEPGGLPTGR